MRKVIKILGMILSAIVLLPIIISLLGAILITIPAVHNYVLDKAAVWATEKLGTKVSLGNIKLGVLGRVRVEQFYVEDYNRDTLLYVDNLDTRLISLDLFGEGLTFGQTRVENSKLLLIESRDGVLNINQVIDKMRSDKATTRHSVVRVLGAEVRNFTFGYSKYDPREVAAGTMNYDTLRVSAIDVDATEVHVDGADVYVGVRNLSAKERCGFVLSEFDSDFSLIGSSLNFDKLYVRTPHSKIHSPRVSIKGRDWQEYSDFVNKVNINAEITNSSLSIYDIAFFAPQLANRALTVRNVDAQFEGRIADFEYNLARLSLSRDNSFSSKGAVRGLPDLNRSVFDVELIAQVNSFSQVDSLLRGVDENIRLPKNLVAMIERSSDNSLSVDAKGSVSDFKSNFDVRVGSGKVDGSVAMRRRATREMTHQIKGSVNASGLDVGQLFNYAPLGRMSMVADVDGVFSSSNYAFSVDGRVDSLRYDGYNYHAIAMSGFVNEKSFRGNVTSRDENLNFDFDGLVDLNKGAAPVYNFDLNLFRADLKALNINKMRRDTTSVVSGRVLVDASGASLDNFNGEVRLQNVNYQYNSKKIEADNIVLVGHNSVQGKHLVLESTIADAQYTSNLNYAQVLPHIKHLIWTYIPALGGVAPHSDEHSPQGGNGSGTLDMELTVKDLDGVSDALLDGVHISPKAKLRVGLDTRRDSMSVSLDAGYVEYKMLFASNVKLDARSGADDLEVDVASDNVFWGTMSFPRVHLASTARHNLIDTNFGFTDTLSSTKVDLNLTTLFARLPSNKVKITLGFKPSYITRKSTTWDIGSDDITILGKNITIRNFFVKNKRQELRVDGVLSPSQNDELSLWLSNFDLTPFTQIVQKAGYNIEGYSSGRATVRSALGKSQIDASIALDSVAVNGIKSPPLLLNSKWDFEKNRARVDVIDVNRQDTVIRGFYVPASVRYFARANIKNIDLGLLNPVMSGIMSQTEGRASVQLTFEGDRREASLNGTIDVKNFKSTIDFTQVEYSVPEAVFTVKNNSFLAKNVTVYDPAGRTAKLNFDLSLQHLSNVSFDISVRPDKLMVLNTTEKDNNVFYGKAFASGVATIKGDKGGVKMNIIASTDDGTELFMPLSSKSNISRASFVTFVEPKSVQDTSYVWQRQAAFHNRLKKSSSSGGDLDISLMIDVRPNALFQLVIDPTVGDIIKGKGEGTINMTIRPNLNVFEMYGDYTILEGSYLLTVQNIINKRFIVESGSSIQWSGNPLDGQLDITALYKLKTSLQPLLKGVLPDISNRSVPVDCIIKLKNRLSHPDVSFGIEIPNADPEQQTVLANILNDQDVISRQFVYLLGFNSFMSESDAMTSSVGASATATTGFELLSNQVSNWVSGEDYNINIRYRPRTNTTSGDELDIGFSKGLIDNRLFIEVEGNYMIDNKQAQTNNRMSSFYGDAYITWLIDKPGNLKLKGFTQTIDRFDENQGLQESGIGIYYKEDFNNLKDLRRRIKERFQNSYKKREKKQKNDKLLRDTLKSDSLRVDSVANEDKKLK